MPELGEISALEGSRVQEFVVDCLYSTGGLFDHEAVGDSLSRARAHGRGALRI